MVSGTHCPYMGLCDSKRTAAPKETMTYAVLVCYLGRLGWDMDVKAWYWSAGPEGSDDLCLALGLESWGSDLGYGYEGWNIGLQAGIWASRLGFKFKVLIGVLNLGFEPWGLGFGPWGWGLGRKPGLIKFYMTVILHFEPDSFSKKRLHVEDQTPDFLIKGEHLSMTPQILLLMILLPFYLPEDFIFSSSSACQLLILFLFLILPFLLMAS